MSSSTVGEVPDAKPTLIAGEITADDYPASAHGVSGTTVVRIRVDADGAVSGCEVIGPSGSDALDEHTCLLMKQRMRYEPAKSAAGHPVTSTITHRVIWRGSGRPDGLSLLKPVWVELELIVAPDGSTRSCKVLRFETLTGEAPDVACPWAVQGMKFPASEGMNDRKVRYRNSVEISVIPATR